MGGRVIVCRCHTGVGVGVVGGGRLPSAAAAGGASPEAPVRVQKSHPRSMPLVGVHEGDPLTLPDGSVGPVGPLGPRLSCAWGPPPEPDAPEARVARAHSRVPEVAGSREKREKLQETDGWVAGRLVWGSFFTLEVTSDRYLATAPMGCARGGPVPSTAMFAQSDGRAFALSSSTEVSGGRKSPAHDRTRDPVLARAGQSLPRLSPSGPNTEGRLVRPCSLMGCRLGPSGWSKGVVGVQGE